MNLTSETATGAADLQPYPAYKPSGIDWLGDVPAHWDVRRLKSVCRFVYGDTLTAEMRNDGDVPVYGSNGQVGLHSTANTKSPCIVIGRKGSFGKVNYVDESAFAIDTTYFVDERYSRNNLRWLFYLLGWIRLDDVTKDSAIPGLGREDAYQRLAPVPPVAEQAAIARYLDRADERISRAIAVKQRLVELLTEQRQAVIHRAVTRGLDADAPLKASGVEWLGDVPAHWDVRRLKSVASIRYGLGQPPGEAHNGLPLIRATNVHCGRITEKDMLYVDPEDVPKGRDAILRADEIIVVRSGAYTADSAIVPKCYEGAVSGYDMVVTAMDSILPKFLAFALLSTYIRDHQLILVSTRTAQPHLNAEELGTSILLLPSLTEQAAIARYLDKATADIDAAMENARRTVELLREYRARLIADAVTGRVDVRGI